MIGFLDYSSPLPMLQFLKVLKAPFECDARASPGSFFFFKQSYHIRLAHLKLN